jgi:hypothetical protein
MGYQQSLELRNAAFPMLHAITLWGEIREYQTNRYKGFKKKPVHEEQTVTLSYEEWVRRAFGWTVYIVLA